VEGIGNQADDEVVLRELSVQGLVVGDIERDRGGILDAGRERLGGLEGPAGCRSGSVSGLIVCDTPFRPGGEPYQQSRRCRTRRECRGSAG
jgi:hypothetical protein